MAAFYVEHHGARYHVTEAGVVIGRALDCTVPVDDPMVSRRHAKLERRGARVVVVDLGSANGTFVNAERVDGERVLSRGDVVTVGEVSLRFGESADAEPPSIPLGIELIERRVDPPKTVEAPMVSTRRELSSLVVLESIVSTLPSDADTVQVWNMVSKSLDRLVAAERRDDPLTADERARIEGVARRVAGWFADGSRDAWLGGLLDRLRATG